MLQGKKTYIGIAILFIAGGLKAIGFIDESMFQMIATLGAGVTAFGLRKAVK